MVKMVTPYLIVSEIPKNEWTSFIKIKKKVDISITEQWYLTDTLNEIIDWPAMSWVNAINNGEYVPTVTITRKRMNKFP